MPSIVDKFCDFYDDLTLDKLAQLKGVYDQNIEFVDPVHRIVGLEALSQYFNSLMLDLSFCRFNVKEKLIGADSAFLTWEMHFLHKNFGPNAGIKIEGSSHLRFEEKITYHRDYFDLGAMVYEHVPMLSYVVLKLKRRLAQ